MTSQTNRAHIQRPWHKRKPLKRMCALVKLEGRLSSCFITAKHKHILHKRMFEYFDILYLCICCGLPWSPTGSIPPSEEMLPAPGRYESHLLCHSSWFQTKERNDPDSEPDLLQTQLGGKAWPMENVRTYISKTHD